METSLTFPIKIAFTGHRHIEENISLINSIRNLLNDFSSKYIGSEIHLYSALAEGSDQLVADLAKDCNHIKLIVPLPLPITEYVKDFQSKQSIQYFHELLKTADKIVHLPTQNDHQTAYHNLGVFLVNECDYLMTIWNGEYTQKKGGTGEVVKFAVEMKMPVYWIYSNKVDGEAINSLKDKKQIGELELIRK